MAERPGESEAVTCPHCRKAFVGELLTGAGQRGYKCPHCRLFVPEARADEAEPAANPA